MQLQLEAELTLETCKHFLYLLYITFKISVMLSICIKLQLITDFDIIYLLG